MSSMDRIAAEWETTRALNRRERIQRHLTPRPIPESFYPAIRQVLRAGVDFRGELVALDARLGTVEQVFMPHVAMLEEAAPRIYRSVAADARALTGRLDEGIRSLQQAERVVNEVLQQLNKREASLVRRLKQWVTRRMQ